jgi:hypothetical protein
VLDKNGRSGIADEPSGQASLVFKWRLPWSRVHGYIYNTYSREAQRAKKYQNTKPQSSRQKEREKTLKIPAPRGNSAPKDGPKTHPNASDGNEAKW